MWGHREKVSSLKRSRSSPDPLSAGTFILEFPAFTTMNDAFLWFISHLVFGILFQQPECTQIVSLPLNSILKDNAFFSLFCCVLPLQMSPCSSWSLLSTVAGSAFYYSSLIAWPRSISLVHITPTLTLLSPHVTLSTNSAIPVLLFVGADRAESLVNLRLPSFLLLC